MKANGAIKEMAKAILCLHIEVSKSVAHDIQKKWNELMFALVDREKEIRQEYDSAIKEKMIQQLWFKAKNLSGKNPKIELSVVERIINEVEI